MQTNSKSKGKSKGKNKPPFSPQEIERAHHQMLIARLQPRGLIDPRQLKERIIWENLKALVLQIFGRSPENLAKVNSFEYEFRLAEQAENYHGSELADYIAEESKTQ